MEAHVGHELRGGTLGEQQATTLDEATQGQQAVQAHAGAHVISLVRPAQLRCAAALAIRHGRSGHGATVEQIGRGAADMRIDHDVELLEHAGCANLLLGDRRERHAESIECVPHPPFVLRRDPRVHDRDARQRERVRRDTGVGAGDCRKAQRRDACTNRRCIGDEKGTGRVAGAVQRERAVGDANTCASHLPRHNRRAPVAEMRDDQRGTRAGQRARDVRVGGQHAHRLHEHRGIGDLECGDMTQQVHRPAGIVVRLRITGLEALQRQHRARELRVRLVESHDPVARLDSHGVLPCTERERRRCLVHFRALRAEQVHHVGRFCGMALPARHHERIRCRPQSARDRALGLRDGVLEIFLAVVRHMTQCDQYARLLVVDVAANAPANTVHRRVGPVPLY